MHGNGRVFVKVAHQILINAFGNERHIRRGKLGKRRKDGVQRDVSRLLVLRPLAAPIALPPSAHVPVAHLVGKLLDCARGFGNFVFIQPFVDCFYQRIEFGKNPPVHDRQLAVGQPVLRRVEAVYIRVQNEKGVSVPQRAEKLPLNLAHGVGIKTAWQPRRA